MKKGTILFTLAATVGLLSLSSTAGATEFSPEFAVHPVAPAIITAMDTFTFDISGFNSAGTTGYILGADQTATFGNTQTYTAAGYNGQDYTISSSEAIGVSTTVDTITVTTPTNFLTTTTVSGTKITQLQFDVGDANSGVTSGTADPLNYLTAVTGATSSGYILYSAANTQFNLTSTPTLITSTSLSDVEGVSDGTTAISGLAVHQFTLTITYPTLALVPEPSTMALSGLGLIGCGVVMIRRCRLAA
jgi:hypothetical protein